ncbi:GNAT family N-acetyltransferase [Wohlfahrtiimonas chitiniclastica]|uniref:GNAT family N-acetyltransferase n=1 Tax=Wohlfahrtiimonas chitiniclastica TaxID=400946 RepID=UPI000B98ACB2|nr:GNAT family N-acetyltransferase [Wohlfahrtiimonas chitiniclastica]OYQ74966.1 GNAT family N-acetyltransferase [Wohlfahrtiimonas chitiniclastica]
MSIKVERFFQKNKSIWNEFLSDCKNNHFMFNRDFMEYHSHLFEDYSLIIRDHKDKVIALLPANIENNVLYSHQGLTFGGFLISSKMSAKTMLQIFEAVIYFLKENHIVKIIYKSIPYIYSSLPSQEDLYALFRVNAKLYRRDISSSIDLKNIPSYSKGRKWGINRAKKNNVNVAACNQASDVWPLIEGVLQKQHQTTPTHSKDEINLLQERFPNNIKAYKACINEEIVAAAVLFETSVVSHAQYLAVNSVGRESSALDYLISEIIEDRKGKIKYFDFGISNENSGQYLNEGLISQKEGFGARAVVHDFYEIEIN